MLLNKYGVEMSRKVINLGLFFILSITLCATNIYADSASNASYKETSALEIVNKPSEYVNKNIQITAKFDKFTILGLDYPEAMRSSEEYVGIAIQRDDVTDHNIPLSEMKLFIKQKNAEKFADLDTGDVIQIQGKVFSAALGDPWVDIEKITILKKAEEKE